MAPTSYLLLFGKEQQFFIIFCHTFVESNFQTHKSKMLLLYFSKPDLVF